MRRLILCLLVVAACGDNKDKSTPDDSGVSDGSGSGKLTGCLDQPGLPTAPAGALPCDLVPPGLQP